MRLTQEQQQKIEEVGRKHRLRFILLHGSYAADKIRRGSDLDIALLGEKPIEFEEWLDLYSDLAAIIRGRILFTNQSERPLNNT
jgi:predicted nucleotidyltransferase